MKRPSCALCERIGAECVYSTTRKRKSSHRHRRDLSQSRHSPLRETPPEAYPLDRLFDVEDPKQPMLPQASNRNGSMLETPYEHSTENLDRALVYTSPVPRNATATDTTDTRSSDGEFFSLSIFVEFDGFDTMPLEVFFDDDAMFALTGETGSTSWSNDNQHPTMLLTPSTGPSNLRSNSIPLFHNVPSLPASSFCNDGSSSTDGDRAASHFPIQLDVTAELATVL